MKHFARVFKIVALSLIALQGISFMLLFSFRNSNFYKPGYAFRNSTNQYDFVILGSSRGLTSIDTKYVGQRIGQKGFNFSLDDSHIGTHELMLEHLVWSKIKMDTLLLVYENSSEVVEKMSSNDYRFLPFVHTPHTTDYLSSMKGTALMHTSQYLPFIGLGYYNIELLFPALLSFLKPNYSYHYDEYGDYEYPNDGNTLEEVRDKIAKLNFDNVQLNRIYDRCLRENVKLIILISPSFKTTFTYVGNYKKFNVIDLSKSVTDSAYFYDQLHLNSRGKEKFTEVLSDHLLTNKR